MNELDLAVREFLAESYENLDQLERDLVNNESDPREGETLGRIFRTVHSIKGACGFLAYPKLESVSHAGEGLLCKLRDGQLEWRTEITSGLLSLADAMRKLLGQIESIGREGDETHEELIELLCELQEGSRSDHETISSALETDQPQRETQFLAFCANPTAMSIDARDGHGANDRSTTELESEQTPRTDDAIDHAQASIHPRVAQAAIDPFAADHSTATSAEGSSSGKPPNGVRVHRESVHRESVPGGHTASIRVDVGLLDKLMNLVGELVLARNQVLQHASAQENSGMLATSQRLNLITTELQEGVMKTRMQPMGNICNKFPRVVRDLALTCGKQIRFEMNGNETELDRTIIEAIKDPLTHLVRNAVDHGIERPAERVREGKPAEGSLKLRAYHESGQVIIEITDDGAGINLERITRRAMEQGLITRDQITRMTDHQMMQLIFLPGFSTAERVTNISGRGVGMDVVKTNIEQIGGTIEMHSRPRQGTTFKIKIPLTLAIIPALIVKAGGENFAIPQVNLLELVRLEADQIRRGIEFIKGVAILRLRGSLLPLVYLDRLLGMGRGEPSAVSGRVETSVAKPNFANVRDSHARWKGRLERYFKGQETIGIEEVLTSERTCELGKWLAGEATHRFSGREDFTRLGTVHRELHQSLKSVVNARRAGVDYEARSVFSKFQELLTELIARLSAFEQLVEALGTQNIVILQSEGTRFGLIVDEINDTEEIVVKPLGKQLKGLSLFAGATIMGDGRVSLILDVSGIAKRADVVDGMTDRLAATGDRTDEIKKEDEKASYLLLRHGKNGRLAIPLSYVSRLEEIPQSQIEYSAEGEVVQYRQEIIPLIRLSNTIGRTECNSDHDQGPLHVVVYARPGQIVGLVVDEILDIVEDNIRLKPLQSRRGLMGRAVIQQRVTDVVDVPGLIKSVGYECMTAGVEG